MPLKPRRVAATTVAARVAEEMRCNLGQEVRKMSRYTQVHSMRLINGRLAIPSGSKM